MASYSMFLFATQVIIYMLVSFCWSGANVNEETCEGDSALYLATYAVLHSVEPSIDALRVLIKAGKYQEKIALGLANVKFSLDLFLSRNPSMYVFWQVIVFYLSYKYFDHKSNSTNLACWLSIKLPLKVDFAYVCESKYFLNIFSLIFHWLKRERGQHSSFYLYRTCTTDMDNVAHGIVCSWQSALLQIQIFFLIIQML